ncbi:MAG: hypothetical protein QOJ73_1467, partial [Streptosporangiaceae bacterium]|nr:hypothetical protein [Streptosporangiaceae bacterium]
MELGRLPGTTTGTTTGTGYRRLARGQVPDRPRGHTAEQPAGSQRDLQIESHIWFEQHLAEEPVQLADPVPHRLRVH